MTVAVLLGVLLAWCLLSIGAALLIGTVIHQAERINVDPMIRPRRQRRLRRVA